MKIVVRLAAAMLLAQSAWGAVSPQEAARLGQDLTPLGGEKAGNADGTIPAWTNAPDSGARCTSLTITWRPSRSASGAFSLSRRWAASVVFSR